MVRTAAYHALLAPSLESMHHNEKVTLIFSLPHSAETKQNSKNEIKNKADF